MEKFLINGLTIEVELADSFFSRLRGLMFRRRLKEGCGLLLAPCNSVHMLFMRFAIDVIYLDKDFCIKKVCVIAVHIPVTYMSHTTYDTFA